MHYTSDFKRLVIYKLLSEPRRSVRALSAEVGVPKSTLWHWKREVDSVADSMARGRDDDNKHGKFSAVSKLRLVLEAEKLKGMELRSFLQREGIHEDDLDEWRESMMWSLEGTKERLSSQGEVRRLERRMRRQEKELKEAKALLELQKKVQQMWEGDEGDDTPSSSDK